MQSASSPKANNTMRMSEQSAKIESGSVHLPVNALWLGELKREALSFPQGAHDDQIDALSQALRYVSRRPNTGPLMGHYTIVR